MKLLYIFFFTLWFYTLPVQAVKTDTDFKNEVFPFLDRYILNDNDQRDSYKQDLFDMIENGHLGEACEKIVDSYSVTDRSKTEKAYIDISNSFNALDNINDIIQGALAEEVRAQISKNLDDITDVTTHSMFKQFCKDHFYLDPGKLSEAFKKIYASLCIIKKENNELNTSLNELQYKICLPRAYEKEVKEKWEGSLSLMHIAFAWKAMLVDGSMRMRIEREQRLVTRQGNVPGVLEVYDPDPVQKQEFDKAHARLISFLSTDKPKVSDFFRCTLRRLKDPSITEEAFNAEFPSLRD